MNIAENSQVENKIQNLLIVLTSNISHRLSSPVYLNRTYLYNFKSRHNKEHVGKKKGKKKTQVHTLSKDETKRLDGPNAKWNALPVKGNLSPAFISISLISAGSFTDTKSWVGPNHSLTTDPCFLCETDKTSDSQWTSNIKTLMEEHTPKKKYKLIPKSSYTRNMLS